ncbi:hypothetical protein SAMN05443665_100472 [Actinomadura meyerae]|uniref:Winged helix DNA-binding domain-containing protein n=1 Tax=Actinomadura meyerae TaxID=240840 RepID=A0A239EKG2_9ACTN|nr:hypothetical protein [Actinomadura meyerae]SNS44402.1 hypothetical protein SAMN05443665_100472 [Actinomadura meyerae]
MRDPLYDAARAVEDAAAMPGTTPVRLHRIALPLFAVEIDALIEERQPYDLLDRFVGRAIAEAGLRTVPEIAAFLGLDEAMVERVLRFLGGVGHVAGLPDGSYALTDLGARSVRDDTRYVPKRDRQKLYFDGVLGGPLPAAYYGRKVVVWDRAQATEQKWHRLMSHACAFREDALQRLAERPDRRDFNVPDELREVAFRALDHAYLPCYVIRTRTSGGPSLLAYSAVSDTHDEHLGRLCLGWPALTGTLDAGDSSDVRAEFGGWLAERDIDPAQLRWTDAGTLRLTLPATRFRAHTAADGRKGTFPLVRLGSYVTARSHVLQLWCDDPRLRRAAILERALNRVTASRKLGAAEAEDFLARLSVQLETSPVTLDDLRRHAYHSGEIPLPF